MKALTFRERETLELGSVPDPGIEAATDAIVRVQVAGVCGSDLHVYHGREVGLDAGTVMGHELAGEVVEVGSEVTRFRAGDRVVSPFTTSCGGCFYCKRGLTARCEQGQLFGWIENGDGLHGAQAEYVRVPLADSTLVALRPDDPLDTVLFAGDIFSTGWYCADLGGVWSGSTVAVIGCGPVGLMAAIAAREQGAEQVFALDLVGERLALAESFGAVPIDAADGDPRARILEATAGRGADAVLEVVGSAEATRLAIDLARPGGTIAAAGVHTEPQFAFSPGEAYDKNLTYRAGRCPARHYMERLLPLIRSDKYDLRSIVTHRLPLENGVQAYEIFAGRRDGCVKVLLEP